MKKTMKIVATTMALCILGASSVFAAQTPAEIQKDHVAGMQTLNEINAGGVVAKEAEIRRQSVDGFNKGMAELNRVMIPGTKSDAVKAEARKGFDNGQKYLDTIKDRTKASAEVRDNQAESGYNRGVIYLKQCGWQF